MFTRISQELILSGCAGPSSSVSRFQSMRRLAPDTILFHLPVERGASDTQQMRRRAAFAAGGFERPDDSEALAIGKGDHRRSRRQREFRQRALVRLFDGFGEPLQ